MSKHQSWEGDATLHSYCYDYMRKRGWFSAASAFAREAGLNEDNWRGPPIEAPQGLLFEWWTVFWDIFVATQKGAARNPAASSYAEYLRTRKETSTVHFLGANPQQPMQLPRSMSHPPRSQSVGQQPMPDGRPQHPHLVQRVPSSSQQPGSSSMYAVSNPQSMPSSAPSPMHAGQTQYTPKITPAVPAGMTQGMSPQQNHLALANGRGQIPLGSNNSYPGPHNFPPSESILTSPAFLEGMRAMGYGNRPPESLSMEEKTATIRFIRKPQANAMVGQPQPGQQGGPHARQPSHGQQQQQQPGPPPRMPSRQELVQQRPPSYMPGSSQAMQERQMQQQLMAQQQQQQQQQRPDQMQHAQYGGQPGPSSPAFTNAMGPPQQPMNLNHGSPGSMPTQTPTGSSLAARRNIPTPINVQAAQKRTQNVDSSPRSAKRTRNGTRGEAEEDMSSPSASHSYVQNRGTPPSNPNGVQYDPQGERPPTVIARPASALANEYIPHPNNPPFDPNRSSPSMANIVPGAQPGSTYDSLAYGQPGPAQQQPQKASPHENGGGIPVSAGPSAALASSAGQSTGINVSTNAPGGGGGETGVSDGLFDFPPDLLTNDFSFDSFIDHSMFPDEAVQLN